MNLPFVNYMNGLLDSIDFVLAVLADAFLKLTDNFAAIAAEHADKMGSVHFTRSLNMA